MVRENQITVHLDENRFVCNACNNRFFNSEAALFEHRRKATVHRGEWCDRHEWLFVDREALNRHLQGSDEHRICLRCDADYRTAKGLVTHVGIAHGRCMSCARDIDDFHGHRVQEHNRCDDCSEEFGDQNEFLMHQKVHQPRNEECFGCSRMFKSNAGILIHLESGTCDSGVREAHINKWAQDCFQHKQYTNSAEDAHRYYCPTCKLDMPKVSSLFQHVETDACGASYDDRPLEALVRYLRKRTP